VNAVLLDLFCGAGGCTKGYQRAGFYVVGVDLHAQPRYCGDEFVQADAIEYLTTADLGRFDAIHASPPCQAFTAYRRTGNVGEYPNLIEPVRGLLNESKLPWVMENVPGAPLLDPLLLCGSMFDGPTIDIRRHRLFESNLNLASPVWPCRHKLSGVNRFPGGRSKERTGSNRGLARGTVEVGTWDTPMAIQQAAMGIDWMALEELSEAIPPAYTEFIGQQLMSHIDSKAAA